MKALIPAAGYGTRFLPASKTIPKEMLPVGAKPAIQLIVEEALADGEKKPKVISLNYLPEGIPVDYVFLTKGSRYEEMTMALHRRKGLKVIATSNLQAKNGEFGFVVERTPLLEQKEQFVDNSFLMLLKVLRSAGIHKVACAGLDGYSSTEQNYAVPAMEYDFVRGMADFLNRHIQHVLSTDFREMELEFVTYSHYTDREDMASAAY